MAEIKLKSCPMCGSKNVETRYLCCRPYIICGKCHVQTPCYNGYKQALEAWNRRADVQPVKYAKWITINSVSRCSNCEYIPPYDESIDDIFYSAYCPNCGAKMENSEVKNNDGR